MQKQKPPFHFPFPHRRGEEPRRPLPSRASTCPPRPSREAPCRTWCSTRRRGAARRSRSRRRQGAGLAADCRRAATRNAKPIEVREKETTEHTPTRTHPKGEPLGGVNRERLLSVTTAHFGSTDLGCSGYLVAICTRFERLRLVCVSQLPWGLTARG